jgi:hypothetical protein
MTLRSLGRRLALMSALTCLGAGLLVGAWLAHRAAAQTPGAQPPSDMIILTSAVKEPDDVVEAIKAYAQEKKWQYLGDSKIRQGQITLVKICIPEVGQVLWPVGAHISAMMPCGNIGVYKKDAATEISTLHPRYMHVLYPNAATERASAIAHPLLTAMLEAVAK